MDEFSWSMEEFSTGGNYEISLIFNRKIGDGGFRGKREGNIKKRGASKSSNRSKIK
jgi:hypothetical protein